MKITSRKVVVIGTGFVGTSIAYSMINQGLVNELVLIEVNQDKAEGEALDLLDGVSWGQENVIVRAGDYKDCKNADIVVVTAGVNQKPGQSRLDLVNTNAKIMRSIVTQVMDSGFELLQILWIFLPMSLGKLLVLINLELSELVQLWILLVLEKNWPQS